MDADYIKWLADYLSDFVSYNKGVFTFKHLKAENVLEIINYLVKVRDLGDEVSKIIITKDINNDKIILWRILIVRMMHRALDRI